MSVLDVRNLSVQYLTENGALEIIKDISFKVEKGEIAGLVGESGSGKSTAMLAVMGLLGDRAVIRADQITVSKEKPVPGKNVAMIFQDSLSCLDPSVKIGRQITETVRARRKMQQKRGGGTRRRTAGYGRDPESRTQDAAVSVRTVRRYAAESGACHSTGM